jgi:hypothetical protein
MYWVNILEYWMLILAQASTRSLLYQVQGVSFWRVVYSNFKTLLNADDNRFMLPAIQTEGIYSIYMMVNKGIYDGKLIVK